MFTRFGRRPLKLNGRHIKRLKRRVREEGDGTVIHGNSGNHPVNYTDEGLRSRILALKQSALYEGANFTRFRELLEEREGVSISYTALTKILKDAGIASKRSHSSVGRKFVRRKRSSRFRELSRADAAPLDWFDDGERQGLHGFIDDATGQQPGTFAKTNAWPDISNFRARPLADTAFHRNYTPAKPGFSL